MAKLFRIRAGKRQTSKRIADTKEVVAASFLPNDSLRRKLTLRLGGHWVGNKMEYYELDLTPAEVRRILPELTKYAKA